MQGCAPLCISFSYSPVFNRVPEMQKQYVGETKNPLHLRLNGHRSDYYRKLCDKPVGIHFNIPGHTFGDLTIMVI